MLYLRRRRGHRIPRVFRDRTNDLDYMDDTQLIEVYRLDRECILELCDEVWQTTHRPTHRSMALPVSLQVQCISNGNASTIYYQP